MQEPFTPFRTCTDKEIANLLEQELLRESTTPSLREEQLVAEALHRFLRLAEDSDN
jgi:hypothetical protein